MHDFGNAQIKNAWESKGGRCLSAALCCFLGRCCPKGNHGVKATAWAKVNDKRARMNWAWGPGLSGCLEELGLWAI